MEVCGSCSSNYYQNILKFYDDDDTSVNYLKAHGVLPTNVMCPICNIKCVYREDRNQWRCNGVKMNKKTKKRVYCTFEVSNYKGSFLSNTRLPPWKIVLFANHYVSQYWDHNMVMECLKLAPSTSVDWRSFCAEVTIDWVANQEAIGGVGVEVNYTHIHILFFTNIVNIDANK